ncbi:MAG: DNA gyrase C-terminal beta-propeller domain-containing protein, partial [Dehalococcoidia bacterium]
AQVIRTNLGEIRSTGRIAQGVKIQVPESGDRISAIRVISERREASAEVDLDALEAGDNGTSEVESESVDQVETEEVEASEEE